VCMWGNAMHGGSIPNLNLELWQEKDKRFVLLTSNIRDCGGGASK
jgi:hypothetical protein